MKIRANILSRSAQMPSLDWVLNITGSIPVYHIMLERTVGGTVPGSFQIDGDDVWAILEIEDGTPLWERAVGFVVQGEAGPELVIVALSNLSAAQLASL